MQDFGALLRMEEELLNCKMPIRPDTSRSVKEYMLLEQDNKLVTNIKVPKLLADQSIAFSREANDTNGTLFVLFVLSLSHQSHVIHTETFLQKELRSEVVVFDNMAKDVIKDHWRKSSDKGWMERWTKVVQFNKEPFGFLRVAKLLDFHTVQWGHTSGGSESRFRKETIAAAIVEYCTIYKYRLALLSNANSAAAHIRSVLESVVSPMMATQKGRPPTTGDTLNGHKLTWPDDIDVDSVIASENQFDIKSENKRISVTNQKKQDIESIKKVVRAVQSCPAAWDPSKIDTDKPTKSRSLRPQLDLPLKSLVKVCLFAPP